MDTLRGHNIIMSNGVWVYADNGQPTENGYKVRPCGECGLPRTPEGHDRCLGTLPGVLNACCGHGDERSAYVQFADGNRLSGRDAVEAINTRKSK